MSEERSMPRRGKKTRQQAILSELRSSPALRIRDLAQQFSVSTETIRRDLDDLGGNGLLSRTYGGAAQPRLVVEGNFNARRHTDVEERTVAARSVAALVSEGDVLMIDAGVTTGYVAWHLAAERKALTVITNGFAVAAALATEPSIDVTFCPGLFDGHEGGVSGEETIAFLRRFNASLAILGASGLDQEGPTDAKSSSAWVKRTMIERSSRTVLVIGRSKFGRRATQLICGLEDLDFVATDDEPPEAIACAMNDANVRLLMPDRTTQRAWR